MKFKNLIKLLFSLSLVLFIFGCGGPKAAVTPMQLAEEPPLKDTFAAGDVLEIKFTYTPQYNESQTISPEGNISLPFIGEVKAIGKSRSELRQELVNLYSPILEKPEIQVLPRKQIKRRVYVGGQVLKPGFVEMPGQMTVFEAIIEAGWVDLRTASPNVLIIRNREGETYGAVVRMAEALQGKRVPSFYLQPQDIVYVPVNGITKANLWIDQYINKMVPQTGATAFYPMGPGALGRLGIDTSQSRVTAPVR